MASSTDVLKLTDAAPFQASAILFQAAPVSSTQGISIKFDFYSYGGKGGDIINGAATGGDGLGVFFIDGSQNPTKPGGNGGSLGYAPRIDSTTVTPGLVGGYLGVFFDEFGNGSAGTEGRTGGPGRTSNSISVRGSQTNNYAYLTGTNTLPTNLSNTLPGASEANSKRSAEIDISPTGVLSVEVDLNGNGNFTDPGEQIISNYNVVAANGALPSTFRFGLAASTGGATNIHEVSNFQVTTSSGQPIAGNFDLLVIGGDSSGSSNSSTLSGQNGNDTIVSGGGSETLTGGGGGDRFTFRGASKAEALRTSTLRSLDHITDFNQKQGDRIQLDFDNNLATVQLPKALYNEGKIKAKNVGQAVKIAYADKLPRKRGSQYLKPNEAIFFSVGKKTYLSVNDNRAPFSATNDLLVDVTGIQFKPGDKVGTLRVGNYFA